MSRVNLEERLFHERGLHRFEQMMKWDRRMALGALALLWHESQRDCRTAGSALEIGDWCWTDDTDGRLIEALVAAKFIEQVGDDEFLIKGNDKQIAWRAEQARKSALGGEANKRRLAKLNSPGDSPGDSPGEARGLAHGLAQISPDKPQGQEQGQRQENKENTPSGAPPPSGSALKGSKDPESETDLELADLWFAFAQEVSRTVKPNRQKWAATFRLMRTADGLTDAEIREMLAFARVDQFWRHNAASATGLRSRSNNGLMKHENIRAAMRKPQPLGNVSTKKPTPLLNRENPYD